MDKNKFHNFHRNITDTKQHWKENGTDEFVGYNYVEKLNPYKGVTVFIPTYINPEDYDLIREGFENVLDKEFGQSF